MLVVVIDSETVAVLVTFAAASGEVLCEVQRRRKHQAAAEDACQEAAMKVVRPARRRSNRPAVAPTHHRDGAEAATADAIS